MQTTMTIMASKLAEIRRAFADYIASEGCACCRSEDKHREAAEELARLLRVPKYPDGSGYDFYSFCTKDSHD